jgi:hypothetical protein
MNATTATRPAYVTLEIGPLGTYKGGAYTLPSGEEFRADKFRSDRREAIADAVALVEALVETRGDLHLNMNGYYL